MPDEDEADYRPPVPDPPEGVPARLPKEAFEDIFDDLQDDYETRLEGIIEDWPEMSDPLINSLVDQVADLERAGDLVGLEGLYVVTTDLAAWIEEQVLAAAAWAAAFEADEAARQDVEVNPGTPDRFSLASVAQVSAATLGSGLVLSTVRESMRWWGQRGASSRGIVANAVQNHLRSLTTAQPDYVLGGSLSSAQREGRWSTARAGPGVALYASEILDGATCSYCRAIDRRWLGNVDDPDQPWLLTYPVQGYVDCKGRSRCRGQIRYVWRGGSDESKWIEKAPWRPVEPTGPGQFGSED